MTTHPLRGRRGVPTSTFLLCDEPGQPCPEEATAQSWQLVLDRD